MRRRSEIAHLLELSRLLSGIDPPRFATDVTAAALHEFDGFDLRPPFHILVPRGRNIQRIGHRVHLSNLIDRADTVTVADVPATSPARTLLSLAASQSTETVTRALDSALRDGKVSEDYLHRRIARWRVSGRNGIRPLLDVLEGIEVTRGGHSWLEREFLRLMKRAGLPQPDTQQVLGKRGEKKLIRVDFRFPGTHLVVEVLGVRFHRSKTALMGDVERVNALQTMGWTVLQFAYDHVANHPDYVIKGVGAALRKEGAIP